MEYGFPSQRPVDTTVSAESLQELQSELYTFLTVHSSKLAKLQNSFSVEEASEDEKTVTLPPKQEVDVDLAHDARHTWSSSEDFKSVQRNSLVTNIIDDHARNLKEFLNSYMQSIAVLRDTLPSQAQIKKMCFSSPEPLQTNPLDLKLAEAKSLESLGSQFNMLVVIVSLASQVLSQSLIAIQSTFTASLIISFLAFVQTIISDDHSVAFDIGTFLAFFAMNVHFGNIIVAGRGSALISQHAADEDKHHDLKYFRRYLELCEQLQFVATIVFLASVVELSFFVFRSLTYPSVLLGFSTFCALVVFWAAYWKVSMTFRNLKFVVKRARFVHNKVHGHHSSAS
ncbi:hypothetical protein H0H81_006446 [Sphagnurus paluster]|uniref:Uncharacterized protein n=1 Tax=Sphagnurus paluster TaxID=117069 RepID=A0A9P7K3M6_9AGAR|nr:hypothetical protein H0H81_006446 [Sphagnurus paluster]